MGIFEFLKIVFHLSLRGAEATRQSRSYCNNIAILNKNIFGFLLKYFKFFSIKKIQKIIL